MPKIGNQQCFKSLYLGKQFENNVRTIRFDITEWVNEFGSGTVELLHMRHGNTVPYSVPISRIDADENENDLIGTYVLWRVSSIDTAQAFSDGQAELRYYSENDGNYLLKSETYRTVVSEALGSPLPEEDWYKSLISKLESLDDVVSEVTAIRDEILSGETGGTSSENNYTTEEKNKLAGIEDGAEANVIISVSVNDTPVDIVDKNISLRIPTKVSELTNDSGYLNEHQDISGKLDANKVGVAGGVAELDENGIIISAQLPSYVDDILEYESMSDFPPNGESGKIYVSTDTNKMYRWSGSTYIEISPSLALGETSETAYRGDRGKIAYSHSQIQSGNPHNITKSDIGLGSVDNTSDADKPISNAVQSELNKKQDKEAQSEIDAIQNSRISDLESQNDEQNQNIANLKSENALLRELLNGVDAPIYRKASGNPAKFVDGYANAALKSLVVMITPTQDGTPSVETPVPIAGYSSVTVQRFGKNLLPYSNALNAGESKNYTYTPNSNDASFYNPPNTPIQIDKNVSSADIRLYFSIPDTRFTTYLMPMSLSGMEYGGTYEFSFGGTPNGVRFYIGCYLGTKYINRLIRIEDDSQFTMRENTDYDNISLYLACPAENAYDGFELNPMIREVGTDGAFAFTSAQSASVSFLDGATPLTVYGGSVDFISGKLTVTHGQIASYDGETVPDGWISSTGELSSGAQIVYPLDTPLSYQLTPFNLTSVSGYNNVVANVGTLSLTYRSDTSLA